MPSTARCSVGLRSVLPRGQKAGWEHLGWQEQGLSGVIHAPVDGEQTRLGAIGLAHAPSGQPMSASTRVHVGSIAKTVIALAVLRSH